MVEANQKGNGICALLVAPAKTTKKVITSVMVWGCKVYSDVWVIVFIDDMYVYGDILISQNF